MIGYSIHLQKINKAGDRKRFGVRFGRLCISKDISVIEITQQLGVSRQTVYNWFAGKSEPNKATIERIRELYSV